MPTGVDHSSPASQAFLSALNKTNLVVCTIIAPSEGNLSHWLANNSHPVGLVIPAGFQANYANHTPVTVQLYLDPQDQVSSGYAQAAVQGVSNAFNLRAANGTTILTGCDG